MGKTTIIKYTCDRCEKEFDPSELEKQNPDKKIRYIEGMKFHINSPGFFYIDENKGEKCLCPECTEQFISFFFNGAI